MLRKVLPLKIILSFCFFLLVNITQGQVVDKVNENVDKNNPKKEEKTNQPPTTNTPTTEKSNTNPSGQAPFQINPFNPNMFDPSSLNRNTFPSSGTPKGEEEDEEEEESLEGIDTVAFRNRSISVKYRDSQLYGKGFKGLPITHGNTYSKKRKLKKEFKVFGWHPYWMKGAYESYNFSLLSLIAYYSYEIDPNTGKYKSIHDWRSTDLVEYAKKQNEGIKVLLSASNIGIEANEIFLSSLKAQRRFKNTIVDLIKEKNADGIHLDFEGVSPENSGDLIDFIADLHSKLKQENEDFILTMSLPSSDFSQAYDIARLDPYIELFVMSSFEFYGSNSETAGPISPITSGGKWWEYSVEYALKEYLAAGLKPEKLLLTVPYYGIEWKTESSQYPSKVKRFNKYRMYRDIKDEVRGAVNVDEASMSSYFIRRDNRSKYFRQIWFEDSLSLAKKYEWIAGQKLGGVGIWALGYDNGHEKLWEALANSFATPLKAKKASTKINPGFFRRVFGGIRRIIRNPMVLIKNPRYLLSSFGILFGLSLVGFLVLYRYGCKMKRFVYLLTKSFVIMLIVLMLILVMVAINASYFKTAIYLFLGVLIGIIIFFIVNRRSLSERELP